MSFQETPNMQLELSKRLQNLLDPNRSSRILDINEKIAAARKVIEDSLAKREYEQTKLDAAEIIERSLKIDGSNFLESVAGLASDNYEKLFHNVGLKYSLPQTVSDFTTKYDQALARTLREIEQRTNKSKELTATINNAETTIAECEIRLQEELDNIEAINYVMGHPDSKEEITRALERFLSQDHRLGFSEDEITTLAMGIMFPEIYGGFDFKSKSNKVKSSMSDIFAMSTKEKPKALDEPEIEKEEIMQRTSRIDYSTIVESKSNEEDIEKPKTETKKSIAEILTSAGIELSSEELALANESDNHENILNIMKYVAEKNISPKCFRFSVKELIKSKFDDFKKICDTLLTGEEVQNV